MATTDSHRDASQAELHRWRAAQQDGASVVDDVATFGPEPGDADRARRDTAAARRFFESMLDSHGRPDEVTTDLAALQLRVVDEHLGDVVPDTGPYANNRLECDQGRLEARLRPMRGLERDRAATVVIQEHAFIQHLRRGHDELGCPGQ